MGATAITGFDEELTLDLDWLLTEPLLAMRIPDPDVPEPDGYRLLVTDAGRRWAVMLTQGEMSGDDSGKLYIYANGELPNFGDDFLAVLGIFEAADGAEFGEWVYVDEPEDADAEREAELAWEAEQDRQQRLHDEMIDDAVARGVIS